VGKRIMRGGPIKLVGRARRWPGEGCRVRNAENGESGDQRSSPPGSLPAVLCTPYFALCPPTSDPPVKRRRIRGDGGPGFGKKIVNLSLPLHIGPIRSRTLGPARFVRRHSDIGSGLISPMRHVLVKFAAGVSQGKVSRVEGKARRDVRIAMKCQALREPARAPRPTRGDAPDRTVGEAERTPRPREIRTQHRPAWTREARGIDAPTSTRSTTPGRDDDPAGCPRNDRPGPVARPIPPGWAAL